MCCFSKNKLSVNFYLKTQKHIHKTKQPLYSASLSPKRLNQAVQTILRSLLLQSSGVLNVSEDKRLHILSEHLLTRLMVQNKQAPKTIIITTNRPPQNLLKTNQNFCFISFLPSYIVHIWRNQYDLSLVSCLRLKKSSFSFLSLSDVL